jgi:hypothetical protein
VRGIGGRTGEQTSEQVWDPIMPSTPSAEKTFQEFYRGEYLPRHADKRCRAMHLLGLLASIGYVAFVAWSQVWWLLVFAALPTYLIAWVGHWIVHNQPTFFEHPWWSFFAFWRMIGAVVMGKV